MKFEEEPLSQFSRSEKDFEIIKPWLPTVITNSLSILDIGCGLGGIDAWLAMHYLAITLPVTIHLMDGTARVEPDGKNQVGFHPEGCAPWKDRNIAIATVTEKCRHAKVIGYDPNRKLTIPADLILSIRSWGHHYPIDEYIDLVKRSLRPGGRVFVDIRKATPGLAELQAAGFKVLAELDAISKKCKRYALERA